MMTHELDELKMHLKSNNPEHDLTLGDIRIQFSKSPRCRLYFSENIIMSKLYEDEIPEMTSLRSHRCDAAILIGAAEDKSAVWTPVEYERPGKSIDRLKTKIKSYYSNEQIPAVFYICQGQSFVQKMKDIDAKIYPHLNRKLHFAELDQFLSAKEVVQFRNTNNDVVSFELGAKPICILPSIDRELVLYIANQHKK